MSISDHVVSVAPATAMRELGLRPARWRSGLCGPVSAAPSEGWGTHAQVFDPVHASRAFYERLRTEPGWMALSVTRAAQLVHHSATPDAYARWVPQARAAASTLTGETSGALTCHGLKIATSSAGLVPTALAELGTARLSGHDGTAGGWAIGSWLVTHASRLGVDGVMFNGRAWTAFGKLVPYRIRRRQADPPPGSRGRNARTVGNGGGL